MTDTLVATGFSIGFNNYLHTQGQSDYGLFYPGVPNLVAGSLIYNRLRLLENNNQILGNYGVFYLNNVGVLFKPAYSPFYTITMDGVSLGQKPLLLQADPLIAHIEYYGNIGLKLNMSFTGFTPGAGINNTAPSLPLVPPGMISFINLGPIATTITVFYNLPLNQYIFGPNVPEQGNPSVVESTFVCFQSNTCSFSFQVMEQAPNIYVFDVGVALFTVPSGIPPTFGFCFQDDNSVTDCEGTTLTSSAYSGNTTIYSLHHTAGSPLVFIFVGGIQKGSFNMAGNFPLVAMVAYYDDFTPNLLDPVIVMNITGFVNYCISDFQPCQNGGTCATTATSFQCTCPSFYIPASNCTLFDYCTYNNNPCKNGATCVNTATSFQCTCPSLFLNTNCTQFDYCTYNNQPCKNGASCTNTATSYSCGTCPSNFLNANCSQFDYCNYNNQPCKNGASCTNTATSYSCGTCPTNFVGQNCTQFDYCDYNNQPCKNGAICTNTASNYSCGTCPSLYINANCSQYDYCNADHEPCRDGSNCVNTPTSYTCDNCPVNYLNANCSQYDYCSVVGGCANGATCTNTATSYQCTCSSSLFLNNNCSQFDYCTYNNQPCKNGASCSNTATSYSCGTCPTNFLNVNCSQFDYCNYNNQPCKNGATCSNTPTSYLCGTCPSLFLNTNCSQFDYCTYNNQPCKNGGTCTNGVSSYNCSCTDMYHGTNCTGTYTKF